MLYSMIVSDWELGSCCGVVDQSSARRFVSRVGIPKPYYRETQNKTGINSANHFTSLKVAFAIQLWHPVHQMLTRFLQILYVSRIYVLIQSFSNDLQTTTDASAQAELSVVVDELLNTLSNKFAGVSSEIFAKSRWFFCQQNIHWRLANWRCQQWMRCHGDQIISRLQCKTVMENPVLRKSREEDMKIRVVRDSRRSGSFVDSQDKVITFRDTMKHKMIWHFHESMRNKRSIEASSHLS